MTGATVKLDEHGDSEGNFSVVALKPVYYRFQIEEGNFTCPYSMISVAQFYRGELLVSVLIIVVGISFLNISTYNIYQL